MVPAQNRDFSRGPRLGHFEAKKVEGPSKSQDFLVSPQVPTVFRWGTGSILSGDNTHEKCVTLFGLHTNEVDVSCCKTSVHMQ
jgi:hypothetical protein